MILSPFILFWLVYTLQILVTYPSFKSACWTNSSKGYAFYFGHHLFDVFLFWSPLFIQGPREAAIHLGLLALVLVHWLANDNQCVATQIMNEACGIPRDEWLDYLKNRLGLRAAAGEYFLFVWGALVAAYDVYIITRTR